MSTDNLLLVIVGAHLRAECEHRPLAYSLRDRIIHCQHTATADDARSDADTTPSRALQPIVCTDVWYLNNQDLLARPVISIGEPGVNAATAFLSARLPTAMVIDHTFRIQIDPAHTDSRACIWGVNLEATTAAIDAFVQRYLADFLRNATE